MAPLQIAILGSLTVRKGAEQKQLVTGSLADLLGILCVNYAHGNEPLSRIRMAHWLWDEVDEVAARRNLSRLLYKLKQWLGEYADIIDGDEHALFLRSIELDLLEFQKLQKSKHWEEHRQALKLYRGALLEDCHIEWFRGLRTEIQQQMGHSFGLVCEGLKEQNRTSEALSVAHRWSRHSPFDEEASRHVMTLYTQIGQPAAALLHYQQFQSTLQSELQIDPELETQQLAEAIRLEVQEQREERESPLAWVGRKQERGQLLDALGTMLTGFGQMLLVTGEPGVGKTRLLESIASSCQLRDVPVIRGYLGDLYNPGPYEPFSILLSSMWNEPAFSSLWSAIPEEVMQSLAPLCPELLPKTPQRSHQRPIPEALAGFVAAATQQQPLVWLLDDLQWAPDEAWDVLRELVVLLEEYPILLVCSYRKEELQKNAVGWDFLQFADRSCAPTLLELGGFSVREVQQLATQLGKKMSLEEAQTLHFQTEGHPLFVMETLENPVPSSLRDLQAVFQQRLSVLSEDSKEVLEMASLLGRSFSHVFWQRVCEPDLLKALPELYQQRLLLKTEQGYRFPNDLLRQTLYRQIPSARKRRWHELVGHAFREEERELSEQLWHFVQAKQWDWALLVCEQALEEARKMHAHSRVSALTEQALKILKYIPNSEEKQWDIRFRRLAYLATHKGEELFQQEVPVLAKLSKSFEEHDPRLCTSYRLLAETEHRAGRLDKAIAYVEKGLATLKDEDVSEEHIKSWTNLSVLYRSKGDCTTAQEVMHQAITNLKPEHPLWSRCLNTYASTWLFFFEYEQAYLLLKESLEQHQDKMAKSDVVLLQNNLSFAALMTGRLGEAWTLIQSKIEFCVNAQQDRGLLFAHLMGVLFCVRCGHLDEARFQMEQLNKCLSRLQYEPSSDSYVLQTRVWLRQALIFQMEERYEEALVLAEQIRSHNPVHRYDYETIANHWLQMECLLALRKWDKVVEQNDEFLRLLPAQLHPGWRGYTRCLGALAQQQRNEEYSDDKHWSEFLEWSRDWSAPPFFWWRLLEVVPETSRGEVLQRGQKSLRFFSSSLSEYPAFQATYLQQPCALELRFSENRLQEVTLVRKDIKLGKTLTDEDRISIFWTPDAGEEDTEFLQMHGKKALRHHRIQRLLKEAEIQGASCTDKALASALDVSVRTIERDMKELWKEGLVLSTRRRR